MPALSLLWVLVVFGHVLEVSSKKTTTLKKRQQVPSSAAGNFLLHSSPIVSGDKNEVKLPWRAQAAALLHKDIKNINSHDRRYLRKGYDLDKSKRRGPFSAEKHHALLRNEAIKNKEILIDNGDEVWPKSEEELETREEEGHVGRRLNFDGSHNEKFDDNGLNSHQETVLENNVVQVDYKDSTGVHKTVAQNWSSNDGQIGINTRLVQQAGSRLGGGVQQDTLLNMTNPRENAPVQSSFENAASGSSTGRGPEAHGDMRNSSSDLEYGHSDGEGTPHIKRNATFLKAVSQPEELRYSSKPITEMEYQSSRLQSKNNGNMSEQLNSIEHEGASKDHDHISIGNIERPSENTEKNYNPQRQTERQSDQDANVAENVNVQRFPQVKLSQTMRVDHFLKMATGIPLYHDKTMPDTRHIHQRVNNSNDQRSDSALNGSMQVLLGREQGDEYRHSLTAVDVSETNDEIEEDENERRQDEQINHKSPIPSSSHVSIQNNTNDLNQTTIVVPISNTATVTKPGLPAQEQTVQEPEILNGPNVDGLKSSEDIDGGNTAGGSWNRTGDAARQGGAGGGMVPGEHLTGRPGGGGGTTESPAPQTAGSAAFEEDALEAHSNYRRVHNADAMRLDRELSNQAKEYAHKIASMHSLTHSSGEERGEDVGENLAFACKRNGVPLTGSETAKLWYDEVCEYDFNRGGFGMNTGHFTQVVWTDSLDLGMGMAETTEDGMKCIYAVGRYRKAGNFEGQFKDKVLRGNFDQSYCNNVKKL